MKRIEDEDKKKEFDKVWVEFNNRENFFETFREECEHFYVEGRESMAKEFWTAKPKRTIVQLISHNGDLRALTSDGRIYRLMEDEFGDESWVRDEDSIPQE